MLSSVSASLVFDSATRIVLDYKQELATSRISLIVEKSYEFHDGQVITIGVEHFHCPKVLVLSTSIAPRFSSSHP